jgi:hypothetical protein
VFRPNLPPKGTCPATEGPWWAAGRNGSRPFHQLVEICRGSLRGLNWCTCTCRRACSCWQRSALKSLQRTQVAAAQLMCDSDLHLAVAFWITARCRCHGKVRNQVAAAQLICDDSLRLGIPFWTTSTCSTACSCWQPSAHSSGGSSADCCQHWTYSAHNMLQMSFEVLDRVRPMWATCRLKVTAVSQCQSLIKAPHRVCSPRSTVATSWSVTNWFRLKFCRSLVKADDHSS